MIVQRVLIALVLASLIVFALVASGCAYVPVAVDKASQANDEAVTSAEFVICRGASIGSIRRAFGDRPDVWAGLCLEPITEFFATEKLTK